MRAVRRHFIDRRPYFFPSLDTLDVDYVIGSPNPYPRGGGRGAGAHSMVTSCLLGRSTIDHSSLSRWSTRSYPLQRDTRPTFRCSLLRLFTKVKQTILQILSPSCLAICGHHLSRGIAILESFGKQVFRLRVRVREFSSKNFEG